MSDVEVRLFRRGDREQLTELVNAHAAAVVPGLSISVSTVLSQLERQPDEFIVDPWVTERRTLVAEQHQRVAAAAHLLHYSGDDRVSLSYRDSGEIRWLVFWPDKAGDATEAAQQLMTACLRLLDGWAVSSQSAAGDLPVSGVFGVPEQWGMSAPSMSGPASGMSVTPSLCTWREWRPSPGRRPRWLDCLSGGR